MITRERSVASKVVEGRELGGGRPTGCVCVLDAKFTRRVPTALTVHFVRSSAAGPGWCSASLKYVVRYFSTSDLASTPL